MLIATSWAPLACHVRYTPWRGYPHQHTRRGSSGRARSNGIALQAGPGARRWAQSKSRRGPSGAGLRHGGRERVMRVGASTPSPRRQEHPTSRGQQYVVTVAVMAGTFLAVMDISVVNVSLPHMMGNFGQTLSAITWVATSYSIAEMLMITMAGWWSALLGRKRLYLASFALFTLGSVLAGTAQTFTQMLIYRIIQGIGGGSLMPV